jgi:hypothetical protein
MLFSISSILSFFGEYLSFVAGVLSFATGINIRDSFKIGFIYRYRLRHQQKKAHKKSDEEQAIILTILLYEAKLYSNDAIKQATAIAEISQLATERAFLIFIERLGSKPKMTSALKNEVILKVKELSKKL